jgi:nicotinate-nucleotide pyrophosphorylase (carboxylating)
MTPMSGKSGAGKPVPDDDPSETPVMRPERTAAVMALAASAFSPADPLAFPLDEGHVTRLVRDALVEDHADEDVTSLATIPQQRESRAELVSRRPGVVCGVPLALEAFRQGDPLVSVRVDAPDGRSVERGSTVLHLAGGARGLLRAERVALNFMQRLSGIATLTAQYVHAVRGTGAQILDTRKTTPGWRVLEKYAVRCGGGLNHRAHLADAVLIKDNHLAAVDGDVALAVERAREYAAPGTPVEIECETPEQVADAVRAGADIVMLDNMGLHDMREAVRMVDGRAVTEASGGVNLQTVRGIAETGVDWISVGALTHSPPALDLALDFEE